MILTTVLYDFVYHTVSVCVFPVFDGLMFPTFFPAAKFAYLIH